MARSRILWDAHRVSHHINQFSGILHNFDRNIVNEASSPTEELTAMISCHSLIPLLGVVLLRCSRASKQCMAFSYCNHLYLTDSHKLAASWSSLITLLKHTCTCTSQSCRVRTSPSYMSALRTHLSWRWWPILKRMRTSTSESSAKIQSEWMILGRMAGLHEATERKKHDELGEGVLCCWWVECTRLIEPSASGLHNTSLRTCSGCKRALYCSGDCQNRCVRWCCICIPVFGLRMLCRDWKGHKKQCTVWKGATTAR